MKNAFFLLTVEAKGKASLGAEEKGSNKVTFFLKPFTDFAKRFF
jgi:hypothetical protein